jgi:hypothetical protein
VFPSSNAFFMRRSSSDIDWATDGGRALEPVRYG